MRDRDSGTISRRDLFRTAGAVGVGALGAGLTGCRGRPGEEATDTSTAPVTVQQGGVFSGRILGLLDGAGLENVTVRVVGFGEVETDPSGRFELRIDEPGDYEVRIQGPGVHTREAAVRLRGNVDAVVSVLEVDNRLPLGFLDEYARARGPNRVEGLVPRTPGATNRWLRMPVVRIYRRLQDRPRRSISEARLDALRASVNALFAPLTGNRLGAAPSIEVRDDLPPRVLADVEAGVIALVQRSDELLGAEHAGTLQDRFAISKALGACGAGSPIELLDRVFAHCLGAWVVATGMSSIVNPEGASAPTARDRAAATFLYARRPGNTAPDRDPEGTFLNA